MVSPLQVACYRRSGAVPFSPLWVWALCAVAMAKLALRATQGKGLTGRGRAVLLAKPARADKRNQALPPPPRSPTTHP
ncbi:MAG: hypothetical protein OXU27_03180 [Candidatus Poribacteria bacterium]|nr:hypothetical protein [Candidatus Poribacteria bacterium]